MTEDLGLAAVEVVRERLGVDDEWCVDHERGFTWWAHDLAQSVWSEEAFDDDGIVIWRLHARIDLVRQMTREPRDSELLSRLNAFSPLASLAFHATEPGTLQLVSSAYVHEESFDWVAVLFQLAAGLQVADGHELATPLANALGAERAVSAHPDHGERAEPDEMLAVVSALPLREGGSRFAGVELERLGRALMDGPSVLATADRDGLSAEFPFRDSTSLLTIETRELHPRLGAGVRLTLALPRVPRDREPADEALELTGLEMRDLTRTHLLGGWCLTPDDEPLLAFHAFFPNVAYRTGVLTNLAWSMAVRASWVAQQVGASGSAGGIRELPHIEIRQLRTVDEPASSAALTPDQLAAVGSAWADLGLGSDAALDDASRYFFAEAFEQTTTKWLELYGRGVLDAEAELALRWMAARVEETAAAETVFDDGALSAVLSMGVGGYVWRLAEGEVGRHIGDAWDEVNEAIGLFEDEGDQDPDTSARQRVLYQSSARCIELRAPLWHTSPGNLIWGLDLFRAGQEFVAERTGALDEQVNPADLFYAFYFGVALFHVEGQLESPDSPRPGELTGSNWESCEIVLRSEIPVFAAEAESPTGRYDAAVTRKLPRFRFSVGFLETRAYDKLGKRHEELVAKLEREGWVKAATRGEHWWSDRFRRRVPH